MHSTPVRGDGNNRDNTEGKEKPSLIESGSVNSTPISAENKRDYTKEKEKPPTIESRSVNSTRISADENKRDYIEGTQKPFMTLEALLADEFGEDDCPFGEFFTKR